MQDRFLSNGMLVPAWPAPDNVRAIVTTRSVVGGVSLPPYDDFNIGAHCGDDPAKVARNRQRLCELASLPSEPLWLTQVHGTRIIDAAEAAPETEADAAFANQTGVVCAVMTADCLPVLLCHRSGTSVAAVHAGWRGIAQNIIAKAVSGMPGDAGGLIAWLGPAIGPCHFEVGDEVREACGDVGSAFAPTNEAGKWMMDLYAAATLQLEKAGVLSIHSTLYCTYRDTAHFYSFRREQLTGRMASLIWIDES